MHEIYECMSIYLYDIRCMLKKNYILYSSSLFARHLYLPRSVIQLFPLSVLGSVICHLCISSYDGPANHGSKKVKNQEIAQNKVTVTLTHH